jgi:hypothetical protein
MLTCRITFHICQATFHTCQVAFHICQVTFHICQVEPFFGLKANQNVSNMTDCVILERYMNCPDLWSQVIGNEAQICKTRDNKDRIDRQPRYGFGCSAPWIAVLESVERCLYHKNISVKQISASVSQDKEVVKKGKEPRWISDVAPVIGSFDCQCNSAMVSGSILFWGAADI